MFLSPRSLVFLPITNKGSGGVIKSVDVMLNIVEVPQNNNPIGGVGSSITVQSSKLAAASGGVGGIKVDGVDMQPAVGGVEGDTQNAAAFHYTAGGMHTPAVQEVASHKKRDPSSPL